MDFAEIHVIFPMPIYDNYVCKSHYTSETAFHLCTYYSTTNTFEAYIAQETTTRIFDGLYNHLVRTAANSTV